MGVEMPIKSGEDEAMSEAKRYDVPIRFGVDFGVKVDKPYIENHPSSTHGINLVFESLGEAQQFYSRFGVELVRLLMAAPDYRLSELAEKPRPPKPCVVPPGIYAPTPPGAGPAFDKSIAELRAIPHEAVQVERFESWRDRQIREGPLF
jgi:hypothetical protein